MIDVEEHVYSDDPSTGHPDCRTRLKDANYFFIGNGHISAAVQHSPSGEGSLYALILMDPDKLKAKRESLNYDENSGFEDSELKVYENDNEISHDDIKVSWDENSQIPKVIVNRGFPVFSITESFYCPDMSSPVIIREIEVLNTNDSRLRFITGIPGKELELTGSTKYYIQFSLDSHKGQIFIKLLDNPPIESEAQDYWQSTSELDLGDTRFCHFYSASADQLASTISAKGVIDASIWQYNREWVRDHSFMALGLLLSGHHAKAGNLLDRLLNDFVADDGNTVDSSETRDAEDVEIDQNGTLLYVLRKYVDWTGDKGLISKYWDKITALAEFPLQDIFRHKESGLLHNKREYWERHEIFGIEDGFELTYQIYMIKGLESASVLAEMIGESEKSARWKEEAQKLKKAVLNDPVYALVNNDRFIKRRKLDGSKQDQIVPLDNHGLPEGIPLAGEGPHLLNPDTSSVLPIALGIVDPDSDIARNTLDDMEKLWDQDWDIGGYGRYDSSSEPDSEGSWPFPSLFVARAFMETGEPEKAQRILDWLGTIPGAESGAWLETYCDRISPPYAQVGITPWTWAEMITLFIEHVIRIKISGDTISIDPRPLPGMTYIKGSLPFRGKRIFLDMVCDDATIETSIQMNNRSGNTLVYNDQDIRITGTIAACK